MESFSKVLLHFFTSALILHLSIIIGDCSPHTGRGWGGGGGHHGHRGSGGHHGHRGGGGHRGQWGGGWQHLNRGSGGVGRPGWGGGTKVIAVPIQHRPVNTVRQPPVILPLSHTTSSPIVVTTQTTTTTTPKPSKPQGHNVLVDEAGPVVANPSSQSNHEGNHEQDAVLEINGKDDLSDLDLSQLIDVRLLKESLI